MSKSSTSSAPKNPTPLPAKSAWARGPPLSPFTAPSPRSQSPASSTPDLQLHSRRPSALGQGIPIKDGVNSNVGAVTEGSAVTFGSIDDVSAPISSSPVPPTKSEGVKRLKTFGSVPVATTTGHVYGKPSISSRASIVPPTASTYTAASSVLSAPLAKPKIDIRKMFLSPSSAPSSDPPSDTSSPTMRNVGLPTQQQQQPHQGQSSHTPPNPSQLAHSYTTFVPSNTMRPPQSNGPNGGPPRSPQYPRQMSNGNGPRSQGGQNGGPPGGLSSPRLAPHPYNPQSSTMPPPPPPQMQPQMQPMRYYQYPEDQPHFMPHYQQWYNPMQMPPQPPPHQPHPGSQMPHTGLPVSPRNLPSAIQNPSSTPTLSHAIASPVHQQPPHPSSLSHSSNSLGLTSPPPTPSTPSISGANRLEFASLTFLPRAAAKLTIKKADGTEVSLENPTKSAPTPPTSVVLPPKNVMLRQGSPGTPNRRPARIRMETVGQHKSRLAEQEQNDKLKAEAADKEKKEKEKLEAERKAKVAEEIRNLERAARLEKEQKELRRKKEQEKARKEAEALELQRLEEEERTLELKQEEERILKTKREEKALWLIQVREKERKEKKEEQERLLKLASAKATSISEPELEEKEEGELEAHKGYGKQDGQLEDGKDVDTETSKSMEDGKDIPKDGLRIVEKSMMIHLAEDRAATSRNRAISLVQEQKDGLTTDQKIAMISCFMEDVVAADTYILLTDPEVRQGWILMMLMKWPM